MNTRWLLVLSPLLAWFVSETLKCAIQMMRTRRLAFTYGTYGGIPSTHATIVGTILLLTVFRTGLDSPESCLALTFACIVGIDAIVLRRHIGWHAAAINELMKERDGWRPLRERLWHAPLEIASGLALAAALAWCLFHLSAERG